MKTLALLLLLLAPGLAHAAPVIVEGDVTVLVEDRHDGSTIFHQIGPFDVVALTMTVETGDRVRVKGHITGTTLVPIALTKIATRRARAFGIPDAVGAQKTIVMLLSFSDRVNTTSVSTATKVVFTGADSVSRFFAESSYGQTHLVGEVVGPYVIPMTSSGCDYSGIATAANQAAMAAGVQLTDYSRRVYSFPLNGCQWWGLGTIGGNLSLAWVKGTFSAGVVAHEMGHNLGLYHSHSRSPDGRTTSDYGDLFDTMGSAEPLKHFNAAQKARIGWLGVSGPPVTTVMASGVYSIEPFESAGAGGAKALKVGPVDRGWLFAEYRQPIGFDAATITGNVNVTNGVLVHYFDGSPYGSFLLDMTPGTTTYRDPALTVGKSYTEGAVTLTTVSTSGTHAVVRVDIGGVPPPPPPPPIVEGDVSIKFENTGAKKYPVVVPPYKCYRQIGSTAVLRIVRVTGTVETVLKSVRTTNPPAKTVFTIGCAVTAASVTLRLNGVARLTAGL